MSDDLEPKAGTNATVVDESGFSHLLDSDRFNHLQRVAKLFASTDLVPPKFKNNVGNCFVALQMALQSKINPMVFMQNCYIVSDRLALETKLAVSMLHNSGLIIGIIGYKLSGTKAEPACTAFVTLKSTGERIEHTLTWDTVVSNGWNSNKPWRSDPQMMIMYRSAMRLIRAHFPDVLMGCYSVDEHDDMQTIDSTARQVRPAGKLQVRAQEALPQLPPAPPAPETIEHGDAWEPDADELEEITKKESEA